MGEAGAVGDLEGFGKQLLAKWKNLVLDFSKQHSTINGSGWGPDPVKSDL